MVLPRAVQNVAIVLALGAVGTVMLLQHQVNTAAAVNLSGTVVSVTPERLELPRRDTELRRAVSRAPGAARYFVYDVALADGSQVRVEELGRHAIAWRDLRPWPLGRDTMVPRRRVGEAMQVHGVQQGGGHYRAEGSVSGGVVWIARNVFASVVEGFAPYLLVVPLLIVGVRRMRASAKQHGAE